METEGSLPCSQDPDAGPYPETGESYLDQSKKLYQWLHYIRWSEFLRN